MEEFKLNKKNYKKGDACCSVYNEEEYPKIYKCISYDELLNLIDIKDNSIITSVSKVIKKKNERNS